MTIHDLDFQIHLSWMNPTNLYAVAVILHIEAELHLPPYAYSFSTEHRSSWKTKTLNSSLSNIRFLIQKSRHIDIETKNSIITITIYYCSSWTTPYHICSCCCRWITCLSFSIQSLFLLLPFLRFETFWSPWGVEL